jgi:hypothetical protein
MPAFAVTGDRGGRSLVEHQVETPRVAQATELFRKRKAARSAPGISKIERPIAAVIKAGGPTDVGNKCAGD